MMRRVTRGAVLLLLAAGVTTAAQQPEYRVEVRLVEVEVRVTDSHGRPVTGLQRSDFTLRENGLVHDVATVAFISADERTVPVPPEARTPDGPSFITVPPAQTWVYVQAEAAPSEVPRVRDALRRFVAGQLQPGFKVSLGGKPFTDDRQALIQTVEQLARGPFGEDGSTGLIDPTRMQQADAEEERAVATDARRQEEGVVPIAGFVARPERVEEDASFGRPFLTEGRIDRQLPIYGDVTLRRYESLVEQLSRLPGKKVVVLLKPGLRVEADNVSSLRAIASKAALHRVSFYTMDSRGLEPLVPADDRFVPPSIDRRRRLTVDVLGKMESQDLTREGLAALASATNGRVIPATNQLGNVFDAVVRDASGYYLIGYYPVDLAASGRYRNIKVRVKRAGLKVDATRGYFEPVASLLSSGDKGLPLRRALLADLPTDLPVAASTSLFAAGDGSAALVLSAGVRANALESKDQRDASRFEATVLVRVSSDDESQLPIHVERRLSSTSDRKYRRQLQDDQTAVVSLTDVIPLPPGRHTWRIVFRDDHSGRIGGAQGQVTVPDFREGAAMSSLLMTGEVLRRADADAPGDDVLDAGPVRFSPQPNRVFRQGETIHLMFDLYNVSPEELAGGTQGPRLALIHEGKAVTTTVAEGQAFPDAARRRIRFACAVDTSGLAPGSYTVLAAPPRAEPSRQPLVQIFVLLPS
jgi:VWFA-related protein